MPAAMQQDEPESHCSADKVNTKSSVRIVEARLSYGIVTGFSQRGVRNFRGVPYGTAARFAAPKAILELPGGRRDCRQDGAACPQSPIMFPAAFASASGAWSLVKTLWTLSPPVPVPLLDGGGRFSEDCLNLQIYTPEGGSGPFPVLVFIHGGAFIWGSNAHFSQQHPWGCKLTQQQGTVVVMVNYRLGALGFCPVPGGVANAGLLDILLALEFVQREISAFGGDPSNVTLAGESAGAMLAGSLFRARRAAGLFHRCVMMSGGTFNINARADADQLAASFVALLPDYQTASVERVLEATGDLKGELIWRHGSMPYQPCFDGDLLDPAFYLSGLDVFMGVADEEVALFVPQTRVAPLLPSLVLNISLRSMNASADVISSLQAQLPKGAPNFRNYTLVFSALMFEGPLVLSCEELVRAGNQVQAYRSFAPNSHAGELGFLFGTWGLNPAMRYISGVPLVVTKKARKQALAQTDMWMGLIGNFARQGCAGLPMRTDPPNAIYIKAGGLETGPMVGEFADETAKVLRKLGRPFGLCVRPVPRARL